MKIFPLVKKTVVDFPAWHRGEGGNSSMLYTKQGRHSALGFACLQSGVFNSKLLNIPTPYVLALKYDIRIDLLWKDNLPPFVSDLKLVRKIMDVNDDRYIEDKERMEKLKEIWHEFGPDYEIEFINVPEHVDGK